MYVAPESARVDMYWFFESENEAAFGVFSTFT